MTTKTFDGDSEIIRTGDPTMVRWNSEGSYTPWCEVCDYEGVAQGVHSTAVGIARTHLTGYKHQHKLKQSLGSRQATAPQVST